MSTILNFDDWNRLIESLDDPPRIIPALATLLESYQASRDEGFAAGDEEGSSEE